jgi:TonB family protein
MSIRSTLLASSLALIVWACSANPERAETETASSELQQEGAVAEETEASDAPKDTEPKPDTATADEDVSGSAEKRTDEQVGDDGEKKTLLAKIDADSTDSGSSEAAATTPEFRLSNGKTEITGEVAEDAIRSELDRRTDKIRRCFERDLARNPALAGKVVIEFELQAAGRVLSSRVSESTVAAAGVGRCITEVVRRVRFPTPGPSGRATIVHTFIFELN